MLMPTDAAISGSAATKPVLVIFPGALGDLICLIPTLHALAKRHAGSALELMARADLARFATGRLGVAHGYSIDRREVAQLFAGSTGTSPQEAHAFFGSFAQVYSFFAADDENFRAALDAASANRAIYLRFRPPAEGHIAEAYLREAGVDFGEELAKGPNCSFELGRDDLDRAEDQLTRLGLEVGRFALILPGSGSITKNWPAENFVALAEMLLPRTRSLVVLGPAEAPFEPIFTAHGLAVMGHLELVEVAALARLAACFVGNDSGVSHLAAAAGARGVAIFGPTDPERWRPPGRTTVIRREPLSALAPAEVFAAMVGACLGS